MTLENLLAIHKLTIFTPTKAGIQKLLKAAERNLKDAKIEELSRDSSCILVRSRNGIR